jgi:tetratricopeptide (TPR) repeat protein
MSFTAFALVILAAGPLAGVPPPAPELAAQPLAAGHAGQAIVTLEQASSADPHDAAVLINLGIAYAQMGEETKARAAFEQALACHEVVELETADGTSTDSRRLARKALKMLDRGEFRPAAARTDQLTYRN